VRVLPQPARHVLDLLKQFGLHHVGVADVHAKRPAGTVTRPV
jgi:phosphoribosylpyrophosphate synthetase